MGGCRCMCIASFFVYSFIHKTQDAFVAGREGPGARGPRSPSSITFQTPGVSIDSTAVRFRGQEGKILYKTTKKKFGDRCLKSYKNEVRKPYASIQRQGKNLTLLNSSGSGYYFQII